MRNRAESFDENMFAKSLADYIRLLPPFFHDPKSMYINDDNRRINKFVYGYICEFLQIVRIQTKAEHVEPEGAEIEWLDRGS